MFLASTSDIIRVVTGSAVSTIGVQAAWVDNASGTYTPGRTNTAITTATTTTVVAAPGASTTRNVRALSVENNHAASSCVVTVQHFDGTTSVDLMKVTLGAGEALNMAEHGGWRHLTVTGAEYEHAGLGTPNLGITGTIAETMPRELCAEASVPAITTGVMTVGAIFLRRGQVCSNISFFSSTTAAGTPTNQIFGLYDAGGHRLVSTSNDTTTAWAANTIKTLALSSAYTVQRTGFYYVAIMVTATTVPTLKGYTRVNFNLTARTPLVQGQANNALTTALPDMMTIPPGIINIPWAAIT